MSYDEEDISSEECLGEEEEDEEECATDEISEGDEETEEAQSTATTPRKPLPQHRPQLPINERTLSNKRRGRTPGGSGLSLGTAASAIKRARGVGIRSTKCTSVTAVTGAMGKSKSVVTSLRKNRRTYTSANTNPIFLHNSSDDEEEEDDDEEEEEEDDDDDEEEEDDMGDEYLERDESEEEDDEEPPGFLLTADGDPTLQNIPADAQARLEAFFEAAGFTDGKLMSDPESLRKLTLTVSSALGEASAAINRMRDSQRKSIEEGRSDSMEEGDSLLALACSSGYFELARVLLAMGANVDDRGSKGDLTPLMDAASQGHIEIVRLLLSHGAEVNAQSACGNSALMYACASGHVTVVEELLKAGAHVEDNNENGHTPLMEAASAGHVPVAKLLLNHGAGINTHSNEFKESALTVACYKGHLDMVRFLLEAGADQQHKTDEMHTALMEASMDGHVEVARLLLDSGAQVNMPADSFESPLTLAACGGHVELAELLLERGANIEEVNDEGYTPLMEAAREGHLCVVKALLKHNALVNAKTEETQETALTLAACGGFLDVVDILLKTGADIELGASTPLMEAAQEGHIQVVKFLMEKGADILHQNVTQDIALSFAAENGHLDVVQLLVDSGSDPEHLSEGGRSPLMKACRGGHIDVIKYLLGKKADVNRQTTSNDHTPLSLACAGGHLAAVELLLAVGANPYHKLKDNSTMIIEAARGGHTPVIRCLLDYLPPNVKAAGAKAQAIAKQGQATAKAGIAKAAAAQGQVSKPDSKNAPQPQPKASTSVLRKCRSTSTLDSAPQPTGIPTVKDSSSGDHATKGKAEPVTPVAKPAVPPPAKENLPPKTVESKSLPASSNLTTTTESKQLTVTDGAKVSTGSTSNAQNLGKKAVSTACCVGASNDSATGIPPGHVHVKRPAAVEPQTPVSPQVPPCSSITAGTVTPTSPSAFTPVSSSGPPLVASQVTAATAISERPKLKSKPRKSSQLLNQAQAQSGNTPPSQGSSSSGSPGSSSEKGQLTPDGSPTAPLSSGLTTTPVGVKGSIPITGPSSPTGMLEFQVQQVLSHPTTGGSPLDLKDIKFDTKQLSKIFAQHQQQFLTKGAALLQGQGNLEQSSTTSAAGTTTTTTTTVVVTHGNGKSETLFDGENLPPGANEVILNAAAAAFPLDCFHLPSALQMGPSSEVHVQSYQVGGSGDGSTTTMQTTTIINAAASTLNNFQQIEQMIMPHHPPPLPSAIAAAAAAAGLKPATGAPPALKGISKKETQAKASSTTATPKISGTSAPPGQAPIPVNQVPPVSSLAAPVGQKKQLAKRSRPLPQGTCSRQSNQQTQTHAHTHGHSHGKQNQSVASTQTNITGQQASGSHFDVNNATESSGETSLSIAAASGHYEVVEFLLVRKANIEHKDKKGCTPLILAADGGYDKVVELLLQRGAEIEAQSDRTKDTALSLACTKGRLEVVDLLLKKGANKEHRNVSDYTPLSLAASGGYVNIIKLLLQNGAEINSRTGSKLGISPLMLAAMNGNTAAVKLLLDMGSDINAQIETNKNTALTLACFQGRQEVVALLLERKANLEHRAKTGLTPLMEAANGGYTEVGKILIERGADVNAAPVPATKDTALTIAADKGHYRFVELLLSKHAMVEVRNKKGCTPIWLACNGGHLDVAQILFKHRADLDVQDNRKVSCLMASFRKGHVKVIRWIVKNVQQFPSDAEMMRYYATIQAEPELLKKCQQCGEFIKQAKDKQALEANKNASSLLEELDMEKSREESKKLAAARRREKKKKKKQEKKHGTSGEIDDDDEDQDEEDDDALNIIDSGIDANSLGSNSSTNGKSNKENVSDKLEKETDHQEHKQSAKSRKRKNRKERERQNQLNSHPTPVAAAIVEETKPPKEIVPSAEILREKCNKIIEAQTNFVLKAAPIAAPPPKGKEKKGSKKDERTKSQPSGAVPGSSKKSNKVVNDASSTKETEVTRKIAANFESDNNNIFSYSNYPSYAKSTTNNSSPVISGGKSGRKDDGWKEVTRSFPSSRSKKVIVPSSVISRVIGRGGCNINAIREATGAHIEVEKQQKGQVQPERTIQIKGTAESTKQAHNLITTLMNEPEIDIKKLFAINAAAATVSTGTVPPAVTPFATGMFSVPLNNASSSNSQRPTDSSKVSSSQSPTNILDNITTFVVTPTSTKSKSSKTAHSPPVLSQTSPAPQKSTASVNGNSSTPSKTTAKKPIPFHGKTSINSIMSTTPGIIVNSSSSISTFVSKPALQTGITTFSISGQSQSSVRSSTPTSCTTPFSGTSSTPSSSPVPYSPPSSENINNGSVVESKGIFTSATTVGGTTQISTNSTISSLGGTNSSHFQSPPKDKAPGTQNGKSFGQTSRTSPVQVTRGLAPGSNIIGPPGTTRSISAADNSTDSSTANQQAQQPLEYSPFNYTFSKTAGWFPGDLAQPSSSLGNSSYNSSNPQTIGSPIGHTGSVINNQIPLNSSAARCMNFASVAASGIPTTILSTATAQMTNATNLQNGSIVGNLGPGLSSIGSLSGKGLGDSNVEADIPKADASKAPGYRGNATGSPVLRMNSMQQPLQQIPSTVENNTIPQYGGVQSGNGMMNMGSGFSGSGRPGMNMGNMTGLPTPPNSTFGMGHDMTSQGNPNSMNFGNNSSGVSSVGISSSSVVTTSTSVPTNIIMSSRLNPRAPSFTLPQHSKIGPPIQPSPSTYQQQQLPPHHNPQPIHNSFKMNNSFGNRNNNMMPGGGRQPGVGPGINMSSGWNPYNDSSVSVGGMDLQNLAALASATGTLDPQILFSAVDPIMLDNQNQMKERLPRPIGGERAWKNAGSNPVGGNMPNIPPFNALDCLDPSQLPQAIPVQSGGQGQGWLGSSMYGPPQQFPQGPNHQRQGNDTRNFLGRRFMDEIDPNRIVDLQQMIDGQHRLMNGGGPPMHYGAMQPPMLYPYGPQEHLEPPHMVPKVDQHTNSWDNHVLSLEEKQNMGWGGKWTN